LAASAASLLQAQHTIDGSGKTGMALRVMVIGGYGNFGSIVCRHLAVAPGIELVISGRDPHKLQRKLDALNAQPGTACEGWCGDAMGAGFAGVLQSERIQLVIKVGGRPSVGNNSNFCSLYTSSKHGVSFPTCLNIEVIGPGYGLLLTYTSLSRANFCSRNVTCR